MQNSAAAGERMISTVPWYALHTRHQHEKTVARLLMGKGFESFLPLYATVHRWKNGVKQLALPLFPCYVFVRGPVDRWLPVLTTPGIHSVVGFGGMPAVIPRSEIEAVRRVVESTAKAEPHPFIKCGDRVRIKSGSLEGLEGVLLRKKSQWKLLLSVEMLERSVAVEIDASMAERVYVAVSRRAPSWLPGDRSSSRLRPV